MSIRSIRPFELNHVRAMRIMVDNQERIERDLGKEVHSVSMIGMWVTANAVREKGLSITTLEKCRTLCQHLNSTTLYALNGFCHTEKGVGTVWHWDTMRDFVNKFQPYFESSEEDDIPDVKVQALVRWYVPEEELSRAEITTTLLVRSETAFDNFKDEA